MKLFAPLFFFQYVLLNNFYVNLFYKHDLYDFNWING